MLCLLSIQFGSMIFLAFGMYMAIGIWSLANLSNVEDTTVSDLQGTMTAYGTNPAYAEGWNSMQANVS